MKRRLRLTIVEHPKEGFKHYIGVGSDDDVFAVQIKDTLIKEMYKNNKKSDNKKVKITEKDITIEEAMELFNSNLSCYFHIMK